MEQASALLGAPDVVEDQQAGPAAAVDVPNNPLDLLGNAQARIVFDPQRFSPAAHVQLKRWVPPQADHQDPAGEMLLDLRIVGQG